GSAPRERTSGIRPVRRFLGRRCLFGGGAARLKVLVLNGPNLGTLGRREPEVYGTQTLADLEKLLNERARELDFALTCLQSNPVGQLIDWLEKEGGGSAEISRNPGGEIQSQKE